MWGLQVANKLQAASLCLYRISLITQRFFCEHLLIRSNKKLFIGRDKDTKFESNSQRKFQLYNIKSLFLCILSFTKDIFSVSAVFIYYSR